MTQRERVLSALPLYSTPHLPCSRLEGPRKPAPSGMVGADRYQSTRQGLRLPRVFAHRNHQSRSFVHTPPPRNSWQNGTNFALMTGKAYLATTRSPAESGYSHAMQLRQGDRLADPSTWLSCVFNSAIWLARAAVRNLSTRYAEGNCPSRGLGSALSSESDAWNAYLEPLASR